MFQFIGQDIREQLDTVRGKLSENSFLIIDLFRERAELAKQIGRIKKEIGLPARIREREEDVMVKMGDMDQLSRSIISSLFEFSILNEGEKGPDDSDFLVESEEVKLSGPRKFLEFIAGLLFSGPGVEVYAESELPSPILTGLQMKGAHIIYGSTQGSDMEICLQGNGENCNVWLSESGELHLRTMPPVNDRILRIRVRQ